MDFILLLQSQCHEIVYTKQIIDMLNAHDDRQFVYGITLPMGRKHVTYKAYCLYNNICDVIGLLHMQSILSLIEVKHLKSVSGKTDIIVNMVFANDFLQYAIYLWT
ncbi:hypothetical protein GBBBJNDB_00292 [Pseudomonas phage Callisto]|nr:hypothetical protein GBBBJNDB_00292 [Pseudomonas phage Callisto]